MLPEPFWYLRHGAVVRRGQQLDWRADSRINAHPGDEIQAKQDSYIVADCLCSIIALRRSHVVAGTNTYVLALAGSYVEAGPGSTIFACPSSVVDAMEGSTIYLHKDVFLRTTRGAKLIRNSNGMDLWGKRALELLLARHSERPLNARRSSGDRAAKMKPTRSSGDRLCQVGQ